MVELNDAYFMSLVSFNGKFSNLRPHGVTNRNMSALELATSRLAFMLLNYAVSYPLYPKRIVRTLRNVLTARLPRRCSRIGCKTFSGEGRRKRWRGRNPDVYPVTFLGRRSSYDKIGQSASAGRVGLSLHGCWRRR